MKIESLALLSSRGRLTLAAILLALLATVLLFTARFPEAVPRSELAGSAATTVTFPSETASNW